MPEVHQQTGEDLPILQDTAVSEVVRRALKKAGLHEQAKDYMARATAGDYNHLLAVSMEYMDFDLSGEEEGQ